MGQRGPRPVPAALKVLAGNPGRRPIQGDGDRRGRLRRGRPDRPPELTGEAAEEWDRVAAELEAVGTLAVADRGILTAYCLAVADMLAALVEIDQAGRFVDEPVQSSRGEIVGTRIREHPAVKLLNQATTRVSRLADALGLTPASRSRTEVPEPPAPAAASKVQELRERVEAARAQGAP
jgi:P27 family predicted phage terminase small subunit